MGKESQELVYPPTFASADAAYDSIINLIADCVLNYAEYFIKTKDWKFWVTIFLCSSFRI